MQLWKVKVEKKKKKTRKNFLLFFEHGLHCELLLQAEKIKIFTLVINVINFKWFQKYFYTIQNVIYITQ